ncbi:MAG: tetratricopeptide repeat protein [Desulfuromusa sp.]
MLESGCRVFDCLVDKLLSKNDIYQSYLVNCSDSNVAKLFLILPDPLLDSQQRQSFLDHADWLSNQTYPGVGSPLKAGEIDGKLACLYPYPQGLPLLQTLDPGYSIQQTVALIKKISVCLSAPHSAGLWHGNLSPETIYTEAGSPYLADFSLNQLIRIDYHSGIDPKYTSPEQVRGETPGSAADIYNLGCVFYHLLTGKPPYSGGDPFAIAKQHLQGEFPLLPKKLVILQPLLNTMTEVIAEKRSSIDEVIDQITKISESEELDLITFTAATEDREVADFSSGKNVSLLDEALDSSEIATRIEARLKEHAINFQEPDSLEVPPVEDATDGLDQIVQEKKWGLGRFILILLLGIVIGSGLYFLLNKQLSAAAPEVVSAIVESKVNLDNNFTTALDQGLKLWQAADFNGAEAEFKQIIADYQEDPRAYNNLAAFYAAQGNYDQARDYLEKALATDENYATIYRNLGSVYAEMARGSYGRALQLDRVKTLISLPVFSSQGVVKLKSVTGVAMLVSETEVETATEPSALTVAGQQIAAVAPAESKIKPSDIPVVSDLQEPLMVVSAEKGFPLETEKSQVVVAKVERVDHSQTIDTIARADLPSVDISGAADKEKVMVQTVDSTDLKQEKAERFLRRWAQAWSNQDVDAYLTFYGEKFIPPAGRSRADWEAQRRTRIMAPKEILVTLDGFQLTSQENDRLRVEVIQLYKSNLFADRFKKVFDLQQNGNSWEILRERSLGRVR